MSLSIFCLFLIMLQNRLTEQATEGTIESTTDNTTSNSRGVETIPTTELTIDITIDEASTNSMYTQTLSSIETTTETTTEDSNSNSKNTQIITSTEPTTVDIQMSNTADTNTKSSVSTEYLPLIQTRSLPSDISDDPENKKLYEQENRSYEKNHSTVNVFGIVLASILSTVAVFYITVSLVKKYRRKSYIVRSPGMELGQT